MTSGRSDDFAAAGGYPIGMVATLTGLPVDVIRVWERRYGLPQPRRSVGGHRLYQPHDVVVLRRAAALRRQGVTAAAACAQALAEAAVPSDGDDRASAPPATLVPTTARLGAALYAAAVALDAAQVRTVLDEAAALLELTTLWTAVLAPTLARVGASWERGLITPAAEHLLTGLIRTRLAALHDAVPLRPAAPTALIGTAPGERHDIATLLLALLLGRAGWAVTYLGADTPREAWEEAVRRLRPRVVVVTATVPAQAPAALDTVRWLRDRLGAQAPRMAYGGPGFDASTPLSDGAADGLALGHDVAAAVRHLAALA